VLSARCRTFSPSYTCIRRCPRRKQPQDAKEKVDRSHVGQNSRLGFMRPLRTSPCTPGPPPPRTVPSAPSPAPAASPSGPAVCEPAVVHERHCRCVRLVVHLVIPRRSGVSHRSTPHKRTAPLHLDAGAYQCEVPVAVAPGPGRLVASRDDVSLPPQPTTCTSQWKFLGHMLIIPIRNFGSPVVGSRRPASCTWIAEVVLL
jgi:hypothetical protein